MANLAETTTYEAGIYQLEITDPVDAGTGGAGISNLQGKQLANRTNYLKSHVDTLETLTARGPVFKDVITLSGDTTLTKATHMGNIVIGGTVTATLPLTAGLVDGDIVCIKATPSAGMDIACNTGQTMPDAILYGGVANSLALFPSDSVILTWKSGVWHITVYSQINLSTPVGAVLPFAMTGVPAGFLKCNGASLSRTTYARLFAAIGTTFGAADGTHFTLPDLRGEFVRGWDDSRGIDAARAFGSTQADDLKAHIHDSGTSGSISGGTSHAVTTFSTPSATTGTDATASTGGTETRPKNVALQYCIKY